MKTKQICAYITLFLVAGATVHADSIQGINMDFVTIPAGGIANDPDTTGYGSVGYTYRIGKKEVSYAQFQASGAGSSNEYHWSSLGTNAPVVKINFLEAAKFCNFLTSGNVNSGAYTISGSQVTAVMSRSAMLADGGTFYVLPTEDEWYKAAYYKDGTYSLYANGTSTLPVQGVDANYGSAASAWTINSGAIEQNGTLNMMGNVWEWTESAYDGNLGMPVAENILFRGGAYNNVASKLESLTRSQDTYSLEHQSVGMRVAVIPEPGTISLMSLSTVGLFLTRSVRRRKRLGQTLLPIRHEYLCDSFSSEQEWRNSLDEAERGEDYLQYLLDFCKEGSFRLWVYIRSTYKNIDKAIWSRMVVIHDRRVERRLAFRQKTRKKMLACFDAFLELIMK